jgi:hypothetical protein
LTIKTENLTAVQLSRVEAEDAERPSGRDAGKKKFVEPEVSFPTDVLESTTFFQGTDSGGLPPPAL